MSLRGRLPLDFLSLSLSLSLSLILIILIIFLCSHDALYLVLFQERQLYSHSFASIDIAGRKTGRRWQCARNFNETGIKQIPLSCLLRCFPNAGKHFSLRTCPHYRASLILAGERHRVLSSLEAICVFTTRKLLTSRIQPGILLSLPLLSLRRLLDCTTSTSICDGR